MSINMADVKQIMHNNKEIVKIQDSLGNILWQKPASITYPFMGMSNNTYQYRKAVNVEWTWTNNNPGPVSNPMGQYYWSDGVDLYYSGEANAQYIYTGSLDNYGSAYWTQITDTSWNGIRGNDIIKINNDIYFLRDSDTRKYDKTTNTWVTVTFNNIPSFAYGDYIWTDGTDIYVNVSNTKIRVLDQTTLTWSSDITVASTNNYSYYYWTDGTDVYYSNGSTQKVWNKANRNWVNKRWSGMPGPTFGGNEVFYYNGEIYARQGRTPYNIYKLNKATSTWTQAYTNPMGSNTNFRGARMWDLGGRSTANPAQWLTGLRRANK